MKMLVRLPAVLSILCIGIYFFAIPFSISQPVNAISEDTLKEEADAVLQDKENIRAAQKVDKVFNYADYLFKSGREDDAASYIQGGLKLYPWDLQRQLILGQWYSKKGELKKAKDAFLTVEKYAEDGPSRKVALVGLCKTPESLGATKPFLLPGTSPVIVLVPVGPVENWLVANIAVSLNVDLGIPVTFMDLEIIPGPASRDQRQLFLKKIEVSILADKKLSKSFLKLASKEGLTQETVWNDAKLIPILKEAFCKIKRCDEASKLDQVMNEISKIPNQWNASLLLDQIDEASRPWKRKGIVFIGVTALDLFSEDYNFQFGIARKGVGLISYQRFTANFNRETPNAERLAKRLEKQALSSVGFTYGVPRCTTAWCARAYPNNLQEHDTKENLLCNECQDGFTKALLEFGWKKPLPVRK